MNKKEFKFIINVEEKYLHPTISLISYVANIVRSVLKSMEFKQSININATNSLEVVIQTASEDELSQIFSLINKYGKVIQNKIPMNKLVGDNEKSVISLKKMLDLIFVELHIFSEIELQGSEEKSDIDKLKLEVQDYLAKIGGLLEDMRHEDDKTTRSNN